MIPGVAPWGGWVLYYEGAMHPGLRIALAFLGIGLLPGVQGADVALIQINGVIGPATSSYIGRATRMAAKRDNACLVIQLDTPGGLLDSTKEIVQEFYASSVPVVVYVAPSGAVPAAPAVSSRWRRMWPRWPRTPASARLTRSRWAEAARRRRTR